MLAQKESASMALPLPTELQVVEFVGRARGEVAPMQFSGGKWYEFKMPKGDCSETAAADLAATRRAAALAAI